jgi:UDP-glucose 4-epimerase
MLKRQRPIIYGDGSKRRDFVFVDDVNDFHMMCIRDARTDGHTYNLGGGANYSVLEICETIANILGSDLKPEFRPNQPGEAQQNLGDIAAARALGWEPRVSLRDGLDRSIAYIREHVMPKLASAHAPI